ncbi:MAG: MFS transporter [bacterium]|nr:MFS transporter [bacterium]
MAPPRSEVGYLELLRDNVAYRRLWYGAVASDLGDWFSTIAIYLLIEQLTGSPFALGLVFVIKMLPFALASPIAGLVADRVSRKWLMIFADVARALFALGLLLVREPGHVWLLYTLSALQMIAAAFFIPARSAAIPNIASENEILTANALSASTWSALLAVGAALGGFVTEWIGIRGVFILDGVTYLVSAFFIYRTVIPQRTERATGGALVATAVRDVVSGWQHMRDRPRVGRIAFTKAAWSLGGGALVYMLALLGPILAPATPALGIGWLYALRGVGTGIGPIAARVYIPDRSLWPAMMGIGIAVTGVLYLVLGRMVWTWWVLIPVVLAHTTSGANWVTSTVLLQERTEDRFRGRVFATEWLLITLSDTVSILVASILLERGVVDLRQGFLFFAAVQVVCGVVWLATVARQEARFDRG